ncbi:MAG: radical SAM protein [Myxococcales bacterium]|nr:radical SAM protein [Myxococcales bacterium]
MMQRARRIHATKALCPSCARVLPAALVERGGDVHLELECPEHGPASRFYFRDARLYRSLHALRNDAPCCDAYDCARGEPCQARRGRSLIYIVNVTNRCNMTCEACFSGSSATLEEPFAPAERLLADLGDARGWPFQPHAVLLGGEPTLHPELPAMVAELTRRGYLVRLASNGLKLRNRAYADRLAAAGLGWVFLHYDSSDDRLNLRVRGRPMRQACLEAIARCRAAGMKVQFGTTLSQENLGELVALVREAHRAGVFWISLYTLAEIERTGAVGATYLADALDAFEQQTRGEVRRADFLAAARLWSTLHRLTGRLNYRQKPTMVSLPVVVSGARLVPVTRFVDPRALLRDPAAAARLLRSLPSLADYERREPSGDTVVLNVQQFQGRSAFDLEEATHSLMSFVHEGSFVPFDVYNHVARYGAERLVPATALLRSA